MCSLGLGLGKSMGSGDEKGFGGHAVHPLMLPWEPGWGAMDFPKVT